MTTTSITIDVGGPNALRVTLTGAPAALTAAQAALATATGSSLDEIGAALEAAGLLDEVGVEAPGWGVLDVDDWRRHAECAPEPRCKCGHYMDEHTEQGGCAGCDAHGEPVDVIMHKFAETVR